MLEQLLAAAARVQNRLEESVAAAGLSLAKLGFLHELIDRGGSMPLGGLADCLCCGRSNVTQLADRLEADGLVRREPDPGDRRSVRAVVTDAGRRRYQAAAQARANAEHELLAEISPADRLRTVELLARLGRAVPVEVREVSHRPPARHRTRHREAPGGRRFTP